MKKLTITARGHDLTNVSSVQELAEKANQIGVDTLQLALGISFPELPVSGEAINPGMGNYFKKELAKKNISVGILSCYINMIHPDLVIREELLHKFERYVAMAGTFGASIVASETGNVLPEIRYTEDNFTEEAFYEMVAVIKRLVEAGERHGVIIGIEPGLNHPLHSLEKVERLIQEIDSEYLGIILDPTNLITKDTYANQVAMTREAFEKFGEKIVGFHLKDFIVNEEGVICPVALGEGLIEYDALTTLIERYRPYSFVVLEETKDEKITKGIQHIQEADLLKA
ncbi:MAG: sugar phosphate isomerase/epimerase family protein [Enterococcus sp.]